MNIWRKSILDRKNGKCKGPELVRCLVWNSQAASGAGVE